jgi:hypothetical protein
MIYICDNVWMMVPLRRSGLSRISVNRRLWPSQSGGAGQCVGRPGASARIGHADIQLESAEKAMPSSLGYFFIACFWRFSPRVAQKHHKIISKLYLTPTPSLFFPLTCRPAITGVSVFLGGRCVCRLPAPCLLLSGTRKRRAQTPEPRSWRFNNF